MVPRVGLEPTLPYRKSILSALRIPFRHLGLLWLNIRKNRLGDQPNF